MPNHLLPRFRRRQLKSKQTKPRLTSLKPALGCLSCLRDCGLCLKDFNVNAEFFPLRVTYQGKVYSDRPFFFMNILDLADVFDHVRGEYTYWEDPEYADRVDKIKTLAIDEKKATPYPVFRIAKGGEYIIGVSDEVARRLVSTPFTGSRFREARGLAVVLMGYVWKAMPRPTA